MTIGRIWKTNKDGGPIARGYIRVFDTDIRIVLWKNTKKQSPKDPDLTIAIEKPMEKKEPVGKENQAVEKQFEDDIPF